MEYIKFKNLLQHNNKSKLHASDSVDNGNYPFFTSSNKITKTTNEPDYFEKSLVIGNGGSANIHYVDVPFSVTSHCYVYSEKFENEINIKYVYYYLSSNLYLIERGFKGVGLRNVSRKYIEEIPIPIVDLETQNKIVAILDKSKNLIEKREQIIQRFDELLRATFLNMFGNPVLNERKWNLFKVSDVGKSRLGKMLDSKKIVGNNLKPYLRNSNVQWLKFNLDDLAQMDFNEKDKIEFSLNDGDVLMCEGGEIGRCAIWRNEIEDCYFQKAIHRIRFNEEILLPEYFVFMFLLYTSIGGLNKYLGGATISHLTGENLKNLKIPVPTIQLQLKFQKIYLKIEKSKEKLNQSKTQLENLLNSLSQSAFNGELKFNTAVDLEILMENDYGFFKKNADKKAIQLLLDRMDKNILNKKKFYEEELYDKAKMFVFNLLEDKKIEQVYEEERLKLVVK